MGESIELRIGEERPVRLPALPDGTWSAEVSGMASAVDVRTLWAADPYPDDDEDEERGQAESEVVSVHAARRPGGSPRGPSPGFDVERRNPR